MLEMETAAVTERVMLRPLCAPGVLGDDAIAGPVVHKKFRASAEISIHELLSVRHSGLRPIAKPSSLDRRHFPLYRLNCLQTPSTSAEMKEQQSYDSSHGLNYDTFITLTVHVIIGGFS